jgi:Uma2 family endonuclease
MPITDILQLDLNQKYSFADYLQWDFKDRIELIKGFIFKMSPAPSVKHQVASRNISRSFLNHFHKSGCQVFTAPFDVRLIDKKKSTADNEVFTVIQPDLCVICDASKLDERGCVGSPDLIIEILSPGNTNKEMKTKFDLYEENGVQEYWIVEPNDRLVLIYVLKEGKYVGMRPFTDEGDVAGELFPTLSFPVGDIFE